MMWKLYLDDERPLCWAKDPYLYGTDEEKLNTPFKHAHTYQEAVDLVLEFGLPLTIDFDHDLGNGKTGYDFALWLVNYDLDHNVITRENFIWTIHSGNVVGANNIDCLLKSYISKKFNKENVS